MFNYFFIEFFFHLITIYEKIIKLCLNDGCDYAEVYYEEMTTTKYNLIDSKLDDILTESTKGIGIRIISDDKVFYTSTNNLSSKNIIFQTRKLLENINCNKLTKKTSFSLNNLEEKYCHIEIPHSSFPISKKIDILKELDKTARKTSKLISQVQASLIETDKKYTIANSMK